MRWKTSKTSLREDVRNLRAIASHAHKMIDKEDWAGYKDLMERIESLASASRWATQDNIDQTTGGEDWSR